MLGRRVLAGFIDLLVLGIVFVVLGILSGNSETGGGNASVSLEGAAAFAYFAIVLGYYFGFESLTRTTPGKRMMGLEVASAGDRPLTTGRIAVRTVLRLVDGFPIAYLLGVIVAASTKRKQRIGDLAARTVVVARGR